MAQDEVADRAGPGVEGSHGRLLTTRDEPIVNTAALFVNLTRAARKPQSHCK